MRKYFSYTLLFSFASFQSLAQSKFIPYDFNTYNQMGKSLYTPDERNHTSIKPYLMEDSSVAADFDSVTSLTYLPSGNNFIIRKLFNEHLIQVNKKDYQLYADFLPDFQIGKDLNAKQTTWTNNRGFQLSGRIGKDVTFQTTLYEVQGKFPAYLTDYINNNRIVPGQGYIKNYGNNAFDYVSADGYVSYTPSKYFTFQLGHGKNFIGDGYRSLLLSDVAFNYPYFKIITTFGNIRYISLWAQFSDFHNVAFDDETAFPKKYGVFHYLDWSVSKRFTIGLFENIMMQPRGFDLNYINPIIFLRPVEFSEGSPDKALVGLNLSYKLPNNYLLYGQLMINEFTAKEVIKKNGYWANKQGVQLGIRGFDIFNTKNLNFLTEFNTVRPFTYSANIPIKNYAHFNQPLAHPLGANFKEGIVIFNYRYKRFDFRTQFNYAFYGIDNPLDTNSNVGKDVYRPYTTRSSNYGYFIGSGIKTSLSYTDLKVAYILNPKINLRVELGYVNRIEANSISHSNTHYITLGLRSSFRNFYYDF